MRINVDVDTKGKKEQVSMKKREKKTREQFITPYTLTMQYPLREILRQLHKLEK